MKATMLKIAGVKSEAAFYKKFPNQEAFMKVHGKEFKKAKLGAEIEKAQFGGNYNLGQVPNFQTPNGAGEFMPKDSFSMATPKLNIFDPQGNQSQTKMAQGIFEGAHSVGKSPFSDSSKMPGAGQILGAATGIMDAAQAFKEQKKQERVTRQNLGVTDVQLQAANSTDVDARRQMQDTFGKQRRAMMQPMTGENLFPVNGVGTNVLARNGGRFQEGGVAGDANDYEPVDVSSFTGNPDWSINNDRDIEQITEYTDPNEMTDAQASSFMENYNRDQGKSTPTFDSKSARDTWVNKTGLPWSEAKRLGYTGGSAKDNTKLLAELNDPRFRKENLRTEAPKNSTQTRTPVQHRETPTGKLTPIKTPIKSYAEAMKGKPKYEGAQGDIHTPNNGNMLTRVGERLANPMQTFGELSKYGEFPAEGFSKHSKNAFDQVLGLRNPAYWANAIGNASDYASEGEYKRALIEAADALPALGKLKYVKDIPFLKGLPPASVRRAGYLGEGAKRLGAAPARQLAGKAAKQIAPSYIPNFTMYQNGGPIEGNSTEIQNTYAPNDIYDDGGYEPLNDSNEVKQFRDGGLFKAQGGFSSFMGAGGTDFASKAVGSAFGNNAGSQMGTAVGGALKMIPGVGPVVGAIAAPILGAIGGGLDQAFGDAGKIKRQQAGVDRNMAGIQNAGIAKSIQTQNQSYMKDGGWVSNDWQPQVIASFGGLDEQEVYDYAHEGMDSLRAGGNLREYTPPSDRAMETYAMGGQLKTHWGGEAETVSHNPYLPGSGETVAFRGQSHTESDRNGQTGIGITYGDNPVEVERGEPMFEMQAGGQVNPQTGEPENTGVVFGNMEVNKKIAGQFNDPELMAIANKYHGKKFKNIGLELSKDEAKQNKIVSKNTDELTALKVVTPFDKLKLSSLRANLEGADAKLKQLANTKITLANYQNAINDAKDEVSEGLGKNISAEHLAKGLIKIDKDPVTMNAKWGDTISKAQTGTNLPPVSDEVYNTLQTLYKKAEASGKGADVLAFQKEYHKLAPEYAKSIIEKEPLTSYGKQHNLKKELASNEDSLWGKRTKQYMAALRKDEQDGVQTGVDWQTAAPTQASTTAATTPEEEKKQGFPWQAYANQALKYLRPTDQEGLDPNQLAGEMYALSSNELEPVQANFYHPEIGVPYDISYQDQLNANQADYRSAQRMMGYNPAAQANLNAQKYAANSQVLGEQFRANQAMKDRVYGENRNILNDAKLKNLGIADQQYQKQSEAKSNTKATTQAALSSMSDKYAKHKLENKTLGIYENMYNYRFGKDSVADNWNPLQSFDTQMSGSKGKGGGVPEGWKATNYDQNGNPTGMKRITAKDEDSDITPIPPTKNGSSIKKNQKNSSVVRAYKNL